MIVKEIHSRTSDICIIIGCEKHTSTETKLSNNKILYTDQVPELSISS